MRFEFTWQFPRKCYFVVVTCILVFSTSEGCAEIAPYLKYAEIYNFNEINSGMVEVS